METVMQSLFDFQKFAENPDLQRIVDKVHARYFRRSLSLGEAEQVAAAGLSYLTAQQQEEHR